MWSRKWPLRQGHAFHQQQDSDPRPSASKGINFCVLPLTAQGACTFTVNLAFQHY